MAYRNGDRYQMGFLPPSIEEYVAADDPVRAYDAFVDALNFRELGIEIDRHKVGNAEYDPRSMVKLLIYGYSYGVKSSRKLERECYHNISFIWLMGGLKPDHKTIAEFRRKNKKALKKTLRHCARICIKLGLIAGNILFVDGTKIRANAARHRTHNRTYYEKLMVDIDRRIEQLFTECASIDRKEQGEGSYVGMNKELAKAQDLRGRIREALDTFVADDRKLVNQTDPDCAIMHSVQGSHAGYNVQGVVDDKHGLIVHTDAVSETSDVNQFARQIEQANELFEEPCDAACADAGYADTDELEKIDAQGIKVVVPSQRQALHEEESPFSKSHFTYDKEQDCYCCPEGHRLDYQGTDRTTGKRHYQIAHKEDCHSCRHYGQCTNAKKGRKIIRLHNEEVKLTLEAQYQEAASQEIYARRKTRSEHPFGHIKRNLKTDAFLLRGRDGVKAETSLLATCFNLARMITIFGVGALIGKLASLSIAPVAT
ncbi:MAG: IS1182 family transposase [Desulfuromonadales bacterium]|nr:IS1182 family transposase [Desulfuromonadales bacterium]